MTTATYRNYSGSAAELYEDFFVPSIATPVSGELLRTADLQLGERVVDVACGTGVITRAAAERVGPTGTVVGVDIAPDMVATAAKVPAAGAPIEWREGDAVSLPLPDESCDVALCQLSLMFLPDKAAAIAEMRRVLAPGGRVLVNTPGRIRPTFEAMEQAIVEHIDPQLGAFVTTVFSMHDPDDVAGLVRDAGFVEVSGREYHATFDLPGPAEFLWNYLNITPIGALVADAPEEAKAALERDVVEAWTPHLVDGRLPVDQPMVLAHGRKA